MEFQSYNINLTEALAPNAEWVHENLAQVGDTYIVTFAKRLIA
jgi:hypothetical protein